MAGKCLHFQRAQLAMPPRCGNKQFQLCSEETPGHRDVIDFSRVRILFQFGFTRNQTNTTVLCTVVHILKLRLTSVKFGWGTRFRDI